MKDRRKVGEGSGGGENASVSDSDRCQPCLYHAGRESGDWIEHAQWI
jgi:hypothetical protein